MLLVLLLTNPCFQLGESNVKIGFQFRTRVTGGDIIGPIFAIADHIWISGSCSIVAVEPSFLNPGGAGYCRDKSKDGQKKSGYLHDGTTGMVKTGRGQILISKNKIDAKRRTDWRNNMRPLDPGTCL